MHSNTSATMVSCLFAKICQKLMDMNFHSLQGRVIFPNANQPHWAEQICLNGTADEDTLVVHQAEPGGPGRAVAESNRRGPSHDAERVPPGTAATQQSSCSGGGWGDQARQCCSSWRQAGVMDRETAVTHHQQTGGETDRPCHQRTRYTANYPTLNRSQFLADRTNGRAYATYSVASVVVVVCRLYRMYCG